MSPADSCGVGMTRFYDRDGIESSARRYGVRSASDPTGPGRLDVDIPLPPRRFGTVFWSWAGAVLAPGQRTVTQALRVMGLGEAPQFRRYHDALDRVRWNTRAVARQLYVLDRLLPNGPVVIGIDDTVERRCIYRDPVRSSKGQFVETSGLRWLFSLMVVVPISWSGRYLALPFLTVLAPSARWSETHRKRHKTLTDWARQAILQSKG
jgi:hypothetical protein